MSNYLNICFFIVNLINIITSLGAFWKNPVSEASNGDLFILNHLNMVALRVAEVNEKNKLIQKKN